MLLISVKAQINTVAVARVPVIYSPEKHGQIHESPKMVLKITTK